MYIQAQSINYDLPVLYWPIHILNMNKSLESHAGVYII